MIVDVNKLKELTKKSFDIAVNIRELKKETIEMFDEWFKKAQYGYSKGSSELLENIAYIDALSSETTDWVDLPILDAYSVDGMQEVVDILTAVAEYAKEQGDYAKEQGESVRDVYQVWLDQGNTGTEQDFLDSLRGEKGQSFEVDISDIFDNRSLYDLEPEGFSFLATDQSMLYIRTGSGWSNGILFGKGDKGEKGDPFTYSDFTPEQILDLKQPALDAAEIVEQQGNYAEQQGNIAASAAISASNARGWTAVYNYIVVNPTKIVKRLVDYIGGTGNKPTQNINMYVSNDGYTNNINLASNFRGADGTAGKDSKSPIIQNNSWWVWDDDLQQYVDTFIDVSSDYELTKPKIESVFTGTISSHDHDDHYYTKLEIETKLNEVAPEWKNITGDMSEQEDLTNALNSKVDKVAGKQLSDENYTLAEKNKLGNLAPVATTGSYNDLTDKPSVVGQLNSDWNASSGVQQILNKPAWIGSTKPTYTKSEVGLGNVDNTSDANKPVSTAQANAINAKYTKPVNGIPKSDMANDVLLSLNKADSALQSFTESDPTVPSWAKQPNKPFYNYSEITGSKPPADANNYTHPTGDGNSHVPATGTTNNGRVLKAGSTANSASWQTLTKSDVNLANVDNTSDLNKPISTATQNALNNKANTSDIPNLIPGNNINITKIGNQNTIDVDLDGAIELEAGENITIIEDDGVLTISASTGITSVAWQDVQNKPTTVSGYGITDVYTKTELENAFPLWGTETNNTAPLSVRDVTKTVSLQGHIHSNATTSVSGFMSAADKDKLDSLEIHDRLELAPGDNITITETLGQLVISASTGLVSVAWSEIQNKPTTVSGFGLTDVYTKSEIDNFTPVTWGSEVDSYVSLSAAGSTKTVALQGHSHSAATTSVPGFMSALDKVKLDSLENYVEPSRLNLVSGDNIIITEDAGNLVISSTATGGASTWADLSGKPTSISGFGITDAYTKSEVDNIISELNPVSWGTETNNYVPLIVNSVSKTVALSGHTHDNATTSVSGFMSAADKTKLNSLENYEEPDRLELVSGDNITITETLGQLVISAGSTDVSWGNEANNFALLTIGLTSKTVALQGHTHAYVGLTGAETVQGVKTFGSIPVLPESNPTTANQATRKQYVDDQLATKLNVNQIQVVSVLPGSPDPNTLYLITE